MKKLECTKHFSFLSSWQWACDDFKEALDFLKENGLSSDSGKTTIWQTRFKDVQLLTVPASQDKSFKIAFKSYREKRFFRYFFRPSLAAREAIGFEVIRNLGIPTVNVLAFGERRILGHLIDAFFITEYEEDTETLLFFNDNPGDRETLLSLLKENIKYLAKLHAAGFIHGGAHPRNILWRKDNNGKLESIWLDLASLRKAGRGKRYWKYILTDLADFSERFTLTQDELDMIMAEYRSVHNIPVHYEIRSGHSYKFSCAVRDK